MKKTMRQILPFVLILFTRHVAGAQQVSVDSFQRAISHSGIQLLDVRTAKEYSTGFLPGTLQADWNNQPEFMERSKGLDQSKPVYVYCLSGVRSAAAMSWLQQRGYTAIALAGGLNAWKKQGLPVANQQAVRQLTEEEFQAMIAGDKPVLVDVSASWCPPCRIMTPRVDSLAAANPSFKLVKIDGAEQTDLVQKLDINAFPSLLIYKSGKLTWRHEGLVDAAAVTRQF